ncbi:MAG: TRAP transporter small permease [Pseudomonadota bacterium]|nr:TRAP transporter small permease [Pseudomonadota bacterium]
MKRRGILMAGKQTTTLGSSSPTPVTVLKITLGAVGGILLLAMMMLTVCDVIGRYIFNAPIIGATELTEVLLAATIFMGVPLVSLGKDHVTVDLVTDKLPVWTKPYRLIVTGFFTAVVLGIVAWRIWVYADQIAGYGGATNSLRLPVAPLGWFCATAAGIAAVISAIVPVWDAFNDKDA